MTFITAWLYFCLLCLIYFVLPFAANWNNFPVQSLFNFFVLSDYVKGLLNHNLKGYGFLKIFAHLIKIVSTIKY